MKRLLVIAGIAVVVIVLIVVLVPLLINVDTFRPDLETKIAVALNRTVHIGKLDASILSGGASASEISVADDPAFSKGPFLQASSVKIGLELIPMIFSKQLKVTSITVQKPEITLLKNAAGKWNYSTLGSSAMSKPSSTTGGHTPEISVGKFEIVDGAVHVGHTGGNDAAATSSYQNVHLVARNISSTTAMPITFSAMVPGGGTREMEGQAGPLTPGSATKTPLDLHIALKHADLGGTGLVDPGSALGGTLDFDGQIKSDGRSSHSEGKATATGLRLVKGSQPAKQAVSLDYSSDYALDSETGTLQANLHIGNSTTSTSGALRAHGQGAIADLKIQGKDMAVNDVEGLLPAFGIVMPSGASLHDGTINMDLTAEGPLDRLVITGPLHVADAHLSGYNLTSKMAAIAAFSGIKATDDTLIQTLGSDLKVAPEGIRADNITLDVPSMGQLTGSGVIGSDNSLNFKMVLTLSNKAGNLLGSLVNIGGGNKNNGIPFLIKGTTSNPAFLPDIGGSLKSGLKNFLTQSDQQDDGQQKQGLGGLLGGFLKKKPKPQQPPQ